MKVNASVKQRQFNRQYDPPEEQEETEEACEPDENTCCKGGRASAQPSCRENQNLNIQTCKCIDTQTRPPIPPPTQQECDSTRECCENGQVMTPKSCPSRQVWSEHPDCKCVCENTNCDTQTHDWSGMPACSCTPKPTIGPPSPGPQPPAPEPNQPDKNGKVIGDDDSKPAEPSATEGIVWGVPESF